jgi:hypothetical protein
MRALPTGRQSDDPRQRGGAPSDGRDGRQISLSVPHSGVPLAPKRVTFRGVAAPS